MSKKKAGSFKDGIQTFGRSLLLPIALLAPIGMVMGICSALGQSYMIEKFPILDAAVLKLIISGAKDITSIIFNNIPILFAMGVAQGMAKKEKGIAVFASVVGYLTLNTVMNVFLKNTGTLADADTMAQVGQGMVLGVQTLKTEALGGLISGLVAAKVADKFYNLELPLAFAFLFISPQLFAVYCVLCGLMTIPYQFLHISIGYIRGTIFDFGIFGLMYENTHWLNLILLGIVNFVIFYFVFKFFIKKWNLETPGRESFEIEESASTLLKEKNWPEIARIVVENLGGPENIVHVENCVSRLRIDLQDPEQVNQTGLRDSGCAGIFFPSKNHIHVVFGPHVEFVRNAVDKLLKG